MLGFPTGLHPHRRFVPYPLSFHRRNVKVPMRLAPSTKSGAEYREQEERNIPEAAKAEVPQMLGGKCRGMRQYCI